MRYLLMYTIFLIPNLFFTPEVKSQKISLPKWIIGTWSNVYESNANNIVFWTFTSDRIYFIKGFPNKQSRIEYLDKKYTGYKIIQKLNNHHYRIAFSKLNERVVYEFKLEKVTFSKKPILTYSLTFNDSVNRKYSSSCNLVLTKGENYLDLINGNVKN